MAKNRLDQSILEMALVGYEAERAKIDAAIEDVRARLRLSKAAAAVPSSGIEKPTARKRTMSAAARKRIAAAQKKRWAAYRHEESMAKPKRKLSAAGRKAIVDALKRRWAAKRKAA